jgi:hypothetical protein
MPQDRLVKRITRWRIISALTAVAIVAAAATQSGSVAQGRVDPLAPHPAGSLDANTIAIATGGGTVQSDPVTIASFGINAKRPAGFVPDGTGAAQGRINYNKHAQVAGRHVNVPVKYMLAEIASPQTGNQTGGKAQLIGDCQAPGAECPTTTPATKSVVVYVEDNADSGADHDVFRITYCTSTAAEFLTFAVCGPADLDTTIRTGNIQIRTNVSGSGGNAPTSARAPFRVP